MNQSQKDRVISLCKLAQENGFFVRSVDLGYLLSGTDDSLLAFAEALIAEQRERDAKICESMKPRIYRTELYYQECADTIRANKE